MSAHAAGVFGDLDVPQPDAAVAVGGSAASLRRLVGTVLEPETMQRALRVLVARRRPPRSPSASRSTRSGCG